MSERDRRDVATHRWCRRVWLGRAIDIAQRVRAEIEADTDAARAAGFELDAYGESRLQAVAQVIEALDAERWRFDHA